MTQTRTTADIAADLLATTALPEGWTRDVPSAPGTYLAYGPDSQGRPRVCIVQVHANITVIASDFASREKLTRLIYRPLELPPVPGILEGPWPETEVPPRGWKEGEPVGRELVEHATGRRLRPRAYHDDAHLLQTPAGLIMIATTEDGERAFAVQGPAETAARNVDIH